MAIPITDIIHLIQPAVALAVLVTGLAHLINALTSRLRRNINYARIVKERLQNLSGGGEVSQPKRRF